MLLELAHFRLQLPEDWETHPDPCDSSVGAVNPSGPSEVIAASATAPEPAEFLPIMKRMGEIRLSVMRETLGPPREHDRRVERGADGRLAVLDRARWDECGMVNLQRTRGKPFLGQHAIVSVTYYQHSACFSLDFVEALAMPLFDQLVLLPDDGARERAEQATNAPPDPAGFLPYVVTDNYFETGRDVEDVQHLGHGCHLIIAGDLDGTCRLLYPSQAKQHGIAWAQAMAKAQTNLAAKLAAGAVTIATYKGPRALPVLVFGPEWLAASCIALPNLHAFAADHLHASRIVASLPHREAMLLFAEVDDAYLDEMVAFVDEHERHGRKRLTAGLFSLGANGVRPMGR